MIGPFRVLLVMSVLTMGVTATAFAGSDTRVAVADVTTTPPPTTAPPSTTPPPPTTTDTSSPTTPWPTTTDTSPTTTSTVEPPSGPANDDFAAAGVIAALPFSASVDTTGSTREPGEPLAGCQHDEAGTLWFSYTAEADAVLLFDTGYYYSSVSAIYTGSTLAGLTEVACTDYDRSLAFTARAGTTYWFQTGEHPPGWGTVLTVTLTVAPPPGLSLGTSPQHPSRFDQVRFSGYVDDPANGQVESWAWDLGDGTTSQDSWPSHRYAADGTYQVSVVVTMEDGRTADATTTVDVRTHDVEVAAFDVPDVGRVGQSRPITVEIGNAAYAEVVTVELYRSVAGSYQQFERFGQLTQSVPVRPDRTVAFPFAYTFTDEDLVVGKVTFKAVAVLGGGAHDALPADNTVIAPATRVRPAKLV
jgi:hypothetical protein